MTVIQDHSLAFRSIQLSSQVALADMLKVVTLSCYGNCHWTCLLDIFAGHSKSQTYCKVLFRTAPENQNQQNQTIKFSSVLFSSGNSWSCLVLGSHIWEHIQNRVQTSSNRTFSDIISAKNMSSIVLIWLKFFFFFARWNDTGTMNKHSNSGLVKIQHALPHPHDVHMVTPDIPTLRTLNKHQNWINPLSTTHLVMKTSS